MVPFDEKTLTHSIAFVFHCVVVNSRQLHYGYSHLRHDCKFICILFHPKLLSGNPNVYKHYVTPFIENKNIEYFHYTEHSGNYYRMQQLINRILSIKKDGGDAYELEAIGTLYLLWRTLFLQHKSMLEQETTYDNSDLALQKKMVSYIYEHYQDTLTLDAISASGNISRSKC